MFYGIDPFPARNQIYYHKFYISYKFISISDTTNVARTLMVVTLHTTLWHQWYALLSIVDLMTLFSTKSPLLFENHPSHC